jgi:hypothetical protein
MIAADFSHNKLNKFPFFLDRHKIENYNGQLNHLLSEGDIITEINIFNKNKKIVTLGKYEIDYSKYNSIRNLVISNPFLELPKFLDYSFNQVIISLFL